MDTAMDSKRYAYFIGIGGIGMSALARFLQQEHGLSVSGFDRTPSSVTEALESEGIKVVFDDAKSALPPELREAPIDSILVIRTPAVPDHHPHQRAFEARGISILKRSELLGILTASQPTLAVAGTHGKTTTCAILAHMAEGCPGGCNAFLGGITLKKKSNLYTSPNAPWTIVEADEFDRSFHRLKPQHAVITSLDADHLETYGSAEAYHEAFFAFDRLVESPSIVHASVEWPNIHAPRYGIADNRKDAESLTYAAIRPHLNEGMIIADVKLDGEWFEAIRFPMPGMHNVENAIAALALAKQAGLTISTCLERLATFPGIERRFAYHIRSQEGTYIDDYAHHPAELQAAIDAARVHHPNQEITGIFQPHLYSRTAAHLKEFGRILAQLDRVFLLPIYAAREEPIPGIDSQTLFENIPSGAKHLIQSEQIFDNLKVHPPQVLMTLGAGDINRCVEPLVKWLLEDLSRFKEHD